MKNTEKPKKVTTEKEPVRTQEIVSAETVSIIEKTIQKEPVRYLTYSRAQLDQIKDVYAKGSSDVEFANFVVVASRTGLDIFKKQIYLVPRWDSRAGKEVFTPQTGIDGYRAVAEKTDAYAGNDDPVFQGELELTFQTTKNGKTTSDKYKAPEKATVTVYKIVQGVRCPFTATARWTEYYPGDKQGYMWRQKGHVMLGKCAESLALRKAFPNVLGGIYTQEEMAMQDSQMIVPISEKKVGQMLEKAKQIISKKTDVVVLQEDLENIQKSEKYNDEQKKELVDAIKSRINTLVKNG